MARDGSADHQGGTALSEDLKILSEGQAVTVELNPWVRKTFDASANTTRVHAGDGLLTTTEYNPPFVNWTLVKLSVASVAPATTTPSLYHW